MICLEDIRLKAVMIRAILAKLEAKEGLDGPEPF